MSKDPETKLKPCLYCWKSIGEEAVTMAKVKPTNTPSQKPKSRPALTPEAREQQMIAYAYDLVEQRLLDGTASSQETTHFLKLGTVKARLELQILEEQKKLTTAKTQQINDSKRDSEMFEKAIKAMMKYSGHGDDDDIEFDY